MSHEFGFIIHCIGITTPPLPPTDTAAALDSQMAVTGVVSLLEQGEQQGVVSLLEQGEQQGVVSLLEQGEQQGVRACRV